MFLNRSPNWYYDIDSKTKSSALCKKKLLNRIMLATSTVFQNTSSHICVKIFSTAPQGLHCKATSCCCLLKGHLSDFFARALIIYFVFEKVSDLDLLDLLVPYMRLLYSFIWLFYELFEHASIVLIPRQK